MLSLATAFTADSAGELGAPLPEVWPTLTSAGVRQRRSEVVMIAGQPNSCKTIMALNLAAAYADADVPTLYICADTDSNTMILRMAARLSGKATGEIEEEMKNPVAHEYYGELLAELGPLMWSFVSEPTPEQLGIQLAAFIELFGEAPHVVIMDNLVNVSAESDSGNEWAAMRKTMKLFKFWAMEMNCCLIVLHHCQESKDLPAGKCPPRYAIKGKLSEYPAVILTLALDGRNLKVAVVKNRHGRHDETGDTYESLNIDPARMAITEPVWTPWKGG